MGNGVLLSCVSWIDIRYFTNIGAYGLLSSASWGSLPSSSSSGVGCGGRIGWALFLATGLDEAFRFFDDASTVVREACVRADCF